MFAFVNVADESRRLHFLRSCNLDYVAESTKTEEIVGESLTIKRSVAELDERFRTSV